MHSHAVRSVPVSARLRPWTEASRSQQVLRFWMRTPLLQTFPLPGFPGEGWCVPDWREVPVWAWIRRGHHMIPAGSLHAMLHSSGRDSVSIYCLGAFSASLKVGER